MYAKYSNLDGTKLKNGKSLKAYHHVKLDQEFLFDCQIWRTFLGNSHNRAVCRPMIDFHKETTSARKLNFTSDASANPLLGVGAYFDGHWFFAQWEPNYIATNKPSIEYLELYGVSAALLTWGPLLWNQRIIIYCDNTAVVAMINNCVSSCANCMYLLRVIILDNFKYNRRVFARYISTKQNFLSDSL